LCVENLELTDANYAIAIALLKRTYGYQDVLVDAHMNKLDSLTQIKDESDTSALRCFQLSIQSHINALENLGIAKRLAIEV
jgi:Flp pilus assembly secretin CpaC